MLVRNTETALNTFEYPRTNHTGRILSMLYSEQYCCVCSARPEYLMYYRVWNYTVLPDEQNKVKNPFDVTVRSLPWVSVWSVFGCGEAGCFLGLRTNKEMMWLEFKSAKVDSQLASESDVAVINTKACNVKKKYRQIAVLWWAKGFWSNIIREI